MRKQRKDSSRNRLTPEQQATVESWLFEENLGYARVVERIRDEFGIEMSVPGMSRLYRYFARMRRARELVEAHVKANPPGELPASDDQRRAVALTLTTNAVLHASCARPGGAEELLPYLRLFVDNERNDLQRMRLKLAERCFDSEARAAGAKDLERILNNAMKKPG